jgi:carbon-monoxide dehydrogenase medium subunit
VSTSGRREIVGSDFFQGYLDTALRSDEILAEVRFPAWPPDAVGSVVEVARRHGDYALVGLVTRLRLDGERIVEAAMAFLGVGSTPLRVPAAEAALVGNAPTRGVFAAAAAIVSDELSPSADLHASAAYRKHLAGVLTTRGLEAATTIGVPA